MMQEENDIWVLYVFFDSDYAGDKDYCLSIGGYVLHIQGVLVS